MADSYLPDSQPVEPLTSGDLRKALELMERQARSRQAEIAVAVVRFWDSVPAHLRGHPLIAEMSAVLASGQPIHPAVYDEHRRRYDALCAGTVI